MVAKTHRNGARDHAERGGALAEREGSPGAASARPPSQTHRHLHRVHAGAAVAAFLLAACTSSVSEQPSACADISGNYAATFTRISGTCDPKIDGDGRGTISFARGGDGTWNMVYPGLDGSCPGTLDASCRFVATCKAVGKDGTTVATASVDYHFTATGFSGSNSSALKPPAVSTGCDATYKQQGNKL